MTHEAGPAFFSPDRKYRYWLLREWDATLELHLVMFIGLNPSTADENVLDPTMRRLKSFARVWGFNGMVMLNLFALRSTDPRQIRREEDPVGPRNDEWLRKWATAPLVDLVVPCWGVHGVWGGRDKAVMNILRREACPVKVFGRTKHGHPKHPLYLPLGTELQAA